MTVIKGAMEATKPRSSLQGSAEARREDTELVASAAVKESETMSSSMASAAGAKLTNESRLWIGAPSSTSATTISISHSSLFGVEMSRERAQEKGVALSSSIGGEETYLATECVLFGSSLFKVSPVA